MLEITGFLCSFSSSEVTSFALSLLLLLIFGNLSLCLPLPFVCLVCLLVVVSCLFFVTKAGNCVATLDSCLLSPMVSYSYSDRSVSVSVGAPSSPSDVYSSESKTHLSTSNLNVYSWNLVVITF
ncbi:hypothetical protein EB796_022960 [Bugula neritina]|uniref:Uncharacterized protein n=1 Tax=Bugula neritina TaxID=10212 RepID=A0A7J7IXT2_BUGNE|nr:hypothetical protein EB796_022960 [Bugula neritina]